MVFNATKFEGLKHGKNEELKNQYEYITPDCENLIDRKESLKDLGIIVNEKSNFEDNKNKVCSIVNQKFGWIMRTFK